MKTRIGKYLSVVPVATKPGMVTKCWSLLTNDDSGLGIIRWYSGWRQYVFLPASDTEYNAGCLRDIALFLEQQNREQKEKR